MRRSPDDADLVEQDRRDRHDRMGWPGAVPPAPRVSPSIAERDDTRAAVASALTDRVLSQMSAGWRRSEACGRFVACIVHTSGIIVAESLDRWAVFYPNGAVSYVGSPTVVDEDLTR